jgi:hypothetical protein
MREALIVGTLWTIYAATRGSAMAIAAINRVSPSGHRTA